MNDNQINQLDQIQMIRLKAVELAIQEIAVYQKDGPLNSSTVKLLNSAVAIAGFIEKGAVPVH